MMDEVIAWLTELNTGYTGADPLVEIGRGYVSVRTPHLMRSTLAPGESVEGALREFMEKAKANPAWVRPTV